MTKILDIHKNKAHRVSKVVCLKCFKRWIAVRPVETLLEQLECEHCGAGFVIETGEHI